MTINNNETPDVSRSNLDTVSLQKARGASSAVGTSNAATSPSGSDDSISLSNSPALVQQALASPSSARSTRIQELKALVENNQYQPDALEVSRALINAHMTGA